MLVSVGDVRLFVDVDGAKLLLAGQRDPGVPIEDAEELAAGLPPDRLRFLRFAGAGHGLAAEQPEAVLSLIREFVLEESEEAAPAQPLSA
jgi:pimeloyl-ACP methyl ester carboxylesterase